MNEMKEKQQKGCIFTFHPIPQIHPLSKQVIGVSAGVLPCCKEQCMFWNDGCLIRSGLMVLINKAKDAK